MFIQAEANNHQESVKWKKEILPPSIKAGLDKESKEQVTNQKQYKISGVQERPTWQKSSPSNG